MLLQHKLQARPTAVQRQNRARKLNDRQSKTLRTNQTPSKNSLKQTTRDKPEKLVFEKDSDAKSVKSAALLRLMEIAGMMIVKMLKMMLNFSIES